MKLSDKISTKTCKTFIPSRYKLVRFEWIVRAHFFFWISIKWLCKDQVSVVRNSAHYLFS